MSSTLPYRAELSVGQQKCTRCNKQIKNETIQLGAMVQSTSEDAIVPKWYDMECFFKVARPSSENLFGNFANLRYQDQKIIRKQMNIDPTHTKGKKATKRPASEISINEKPSQISDFAVYGTRPSVDLCMCCFQSIGKESVRILKIIRGIGEDTEDTHCWYHLDCFVKHSSSLGWYEAAEDLPGYEDLNDDAIKERIKQKLRANDDNNNKPALKKFKEGSLDDVNDIIETKIKLQNREFFELRENLERLKADELTDILKTNAQFVPNDKLDILNHVTDVIYFGALESCEKCKNGKFIFENASYVCMGDFSGFAKCNNEIRVPLRYQANIPENIRSAYFFLKAKLMIRIRATKILPPNLVNAVNTKKPLFGMEFAIVGQLVKSSKEIRSTIEAMGGKIIYMLNTKTAAVISNAEEVEKDEIDMKFQIKQAKMMGIQVVSEDFIEAVKNDDPYAVINDKNMAQWICNDPSSRIPLNGVTIRKSDSFYTDAALSAQKWKNGIAVDAECNLENAHVYRRDGAIYVASMALVDIVMNKNSYCRMQLIEADDEKRYWIFEKQGRISTNIGSTTLEDFKSVAEAKIAFERRYMELTDNQFGAPTFEKKPEKFQILNIVFDQPDKVLNSLVESKLSPSVLNVMKLICDEKAMQNIMLEFQLDTDLIPLGRISKNQIEIAREILKEISVLLKVKVSNERFIEASNRFYTMIPHKFVQDRPTVINTYDMVRQKYAMLDRLREIEFTYSLLDDVDQNKNPLDSLYHKLNTVITSIDQKSIEYDQIIKYIQQTYDASYFHYDIEVEEIHEITRHGENARFRPYSKLHNRKLLWHGSSLTNFVSILSNGLTTTPSDVLINGKAFGNGIYFADTIGKSAWYCYRVGGESALLVLCEVALGDMLETQTFDNQINTRLNGKHSVKGVGKMQAPFEIQRADGVRIPYGIPQNVAGTNSELALNEFVVYNEAQVKMRYLVKVKFKNYSHMQYPNDDDDSTNSCSDNESDAEATIDSDIETIVLSD